VERTQLQHLQLLVIFGPVGFQGLNAPAAQRLVKPAPLKEHPGRVNTLLNPHIRRYVDVSYSEGVQHFKAALACP
jgi:hypothetical protein